MGATVLVRNVSLRDLGVAPGMLLEMRARLTGGAGDSHPLAALAVFRVQKYETWREYLAGSPTIAEALTRAIEKMIGRFASNLPSVLTDVSVNCPGLEPEHMWTLLVFRNICRCPVGLPRDEICAGSPGGVSQP